MATNWYKHIKKVKCGKVQMRSRFECDVWKAAIKHRSDISYEKEYLSYLLKSWYLPDITFKKKNGDLIYVELKGWFNSEDRTKMRAVKKGAPDKDIRMVFMADKKISKAPKSMLYSRWCELNGFKCAIGRIPKEWLLE